MTISWTHLASNVNAITPETNGVAELVPSNVLIQRL